MNLLVEWLKFEEGFRSRPYRDTRAVLTVGYGRNLQANPLPGRDFRSEPCTETEAEGWLKEEISRVYARLKERKPVVAEVDSVRSAALVNMAYQLGLGGVLKFSRMWSAVEARNWLGAGKEALDSRWAVQTPARASRVVGALVSGRWPDEVERVRG